MKIAVAMSGGVDSCLVAELMCQKYGKENVFGIFMETYIGIDVKPALTAADSVGIDLYFAQYENIFHNVVKSYFVSSYHRGLTPNPCVKCNERIKFGALWEYAKQSGADKMATGHYAVLDNGRLYRGIDKDKDQSYFLYRLNPSLLSDDVFLFPLGQQTKTETRRLAKLFRLSAADKSESQNVCFISGHHTEHTGPGVEGNILDINGNVLGRHKGICHYTKGQRKGFGSFGKNSMYVIDIVGKDIIIGTEDWLFNDHDIYLTDTVWHRKPEPNEEIEIQQKYHGNLIKATITTDNNTAEVKLDGIHSHASYGQSVVVYKGNEVLGGGIITRR